MAMAQQPLQFPMSAVPEGIANASANATAQPESLVAAALAEVQASPVRYLVPTILLALFTYYYRASIPEMDSREPQMILPRIPLIGHILGMLKNQSEYYTSLQKRSGLPAATLPIMGGKMYAIWDPALIQSTLRQKTLSFEPFAVDFVQTMLGMSDSSYVGFRDTPERPSLVPEFFEVLHVTFRGEALHRMNAGALKYVSGRLDLVAGDKTTAVPNFYLWLREMVTMATTTALLGKGNPLLHDPALVDHLWVWETAIPSMLLIPYHSVTNAEAFRSREIVQKALGEYYGAKMDLDESAAEVTRGRAAVLRKYDLPDSEIGRFEASLIQLATGNTIPTAFWLISHVFARPALLARLREEVENAVERDAATPDQLTINVSKFEERCPLFVSAYREAVRLSNHALCVRRVMKDTTISDGRGTEFVLKEGESLQIPAGFTHRLDSIWGDDVLEYDPERFVGRQAKLSAQTEKTKRNAYIPFGGGKHLCPGRNFAFAEILGVAAAFVMGFDIKDGGGKDAPVRLPEMANTTIIGGATKPEKMAEGMDVNIRRRPGWEKTKFDFIVSS